MDQFLKETQGRAFRVAMISVRDRDVALDMVQEAMLKLARNYAQKSAEEWPPLFYRILQNRIRDYHRKQVVKNRVIVQPRATEEREDAWDPIAEAADTAQAGPADKLKADDAVEKLNEAVQQLPQRQREVFLLRAVEEMSVAQSAASLELSEGSIKTHYFRALNALREMLGEHWP